MDLDEGLKYQTELLKIERMLQEIKALGLDTTTIETLLTKITQNLKKEKEEIKKRILKDQDSTESIQSFFQENCYAPCYRKALQDLSNLEQGLVKNYDIYVRINGNLTYIENNLENLEEDNLSKLISMMKETLTDIKESTFLDHEEEQKLIEKTYALAYRLIKIELMFKEESSLLNTVLTNDIDIQNVERILLLEIKSLDPTQPFMKEILKKIKDLSPKGLMNIYLKESTYLDLDLLRLLAYVKNEHLIEKKKESLTDTYQQLDQQQIALADLETEAESVWNTINERKNYQKANKIGMVRYGGYIVGMSSLMLASFLGITSFGKKITSTKTYYAKTTTYDVTKDQITPSEGYQDKKENSVYLKQYMPYKENEQFQKAPGSSSIMNKSPYVREIYTYDVSDIDYVDMKDYTNINLEDFPFEPVVEEEYAQILSPSDNYKEPRTIIQKIDVTPEKTESKVDPFAFWLLAILVNGMILTLEGIFFYVYGFDKSNISPSWWENLMPNVRQYRDQKISINELKQHLQELKKLMGQQNQTLQELQYQLEEEYHQLPQLLKQDQSLVKVRKKIKKEGDKNGTSR